jgi:hypothetical protein
MTDDPFDDPGWQDYVAHVRTELVPKLDSSAYVMTLVPDAADVDVKFAVELGLSIMMDKPIIAVVHTNAKPPERLVRAVDAIVEGDITTEAGREKLMYSVKAAMDRLGLG